GAPFVVPGSVVPNSPKALLAADLHEDTTRRLPPTRPHRNGWGDSWCRRPSPTRAGAVVAHYRRRQEGWPQPTRKAGSQLHAGTPGVAPGMERKMGPGRMVVILGDPFAGGQQVHLVAEFFFGLAEFGHEVVLDGLVA